VNKLPFDEVGVWLLIVASIVIVVECVVAGIWSVRVAMQTRELSVMIAREQVAINEDLQRLRLALEETKRLWQPYARVLRWLNHPLVIALFASYRRRRAAR
jgi:hypothetical protein